MPTTSLPAQRRRTSTASSPSGIITAVVAVTGVEDAVSDVIVPGSFARTFAIRRPKVVFHHDWLRFLGRSLSYVELMPGDPRLPKRTKEGLPWPAEAGAVVAVMQFNLNVDAGRDGYEWARFYTESNECEWSIGYKATRASKGKDGLRYIYDLDVFEFSLVLFGAASLSMTMDIKALQGHDDLECKTVPFGAQLLDQVLADFQRDALALEGKSAESMVGTGVMVALYPPADVAAQLAVEDGTGAEDLHVTLAFLGKSEDWDGSDMQAVADSLTTAAQDPQWRNKIGGPPLTGTVGGLGQFVDNGDGAPTYVPVDVPGLESLREALVNDLFQQGHGPRVAMNHGFTPHMTLGYALEGVAPVPSTDVSFSEAYLVVGPDRYPIPLGGEAPQLEVKAAAAAVLEARRFGTTGHTAFDAVREAKAIMERSGPGGAQVRRGGGNMVAGTGRPAPAAAAKPATARKPAVRTAAPAPGGGSFDEAKHPRGKKGTPEGGQFVSKGSGYESTGRADEADDVTKAQAALIDGGFLGDSDGKDGKGDDGYFGRKTEAAVKKWQSEMGYEATGKLSGDQFDELTGGRSGKDRGRDDDEDLDEDEDDSPGRRSSRGRRRRPRKDEDDKDAVGRDKYLPDGKRNPEYGKERNVATVTGPRQRPMPTDTPGKATSAGEVGRGAGYNSTGRQSESAEVKKAQTALIAAGMLGKADGKDGQGADGLFGRKTEAAVKKWQSKMGYEPSGKLSREQMGELTGAMKPATPGRKPASVPTPGFGKRKPGPAPAVQQEQPKVGRPKRAFGDRTSDRSRMQTKSAWDTVLEAKYDTSSTASPGPENWIEQVGGSLDPFIKAVVNALIRERGKTEEEAHAIAIGRMKTWAAGGGDVTAKTRAKAVKALANWQALKAKAASIPPMEGKSMYQEMPGSYEAVRDQLREAAQDLFKKPTPRGGDEIGCYVSVEATFPTYAVVSHEQDGKRSTYQVPYTTTDGEVSLGKPEEITLKVVIEGSDDKVDAGDEAMVRFARPAVGMLDEATALVMMGGAEGKSAEVLRPALLRLMDALAVKGMPDVHDNGDDGFLDDEDEPEVDPTLADDYVEPTAEPIVEQLVDEPAEDELVDDLEEKRMTLDPDEVARQLEALRL